MAKKSEPMVFVLIPAPPPVFNGIRVFDSLVSVIEYLCDISPDDEMPVQLNPRKGENHGWDVKLTDGSSFAVFRRPIEFYEIKEPGNG